MHRHVLRDVADRHPGSQFAGIVAADAVRDDVDLLGGHHEERIFVAAAQSAFIRFESYADHKIFFLIRQ